MTMFLDDGLAGAHSYIDTMLLGSSIKADLLKSGFIPNSIKSIWVPTQQCEFLGCDLDTVEGTIYIPNRRVLKAVDNISELICSA